jgi:5-methylcytosine-specific restriction endonuclease McrA
MNDGPAPMEIDWTSHRWGLLSNAEKQWRRANHLCLYCGRLGI